MPRVRAVLLVLVVMAGLAAPVLPASATSDPQYVTPQGETVKENAHLARVQLTLRKKAHMRYKIPFRTVAGSAKPGRDYKTTKGTVTIKKGAKSVSVWIPLINDKVIEPTEKFTVKFKRTSRWYALTKNEVTITVLDDEVVKKWSGDITVHVTQHEVQNPTTIDEDWTFVAHLVLKADQWGTSWFPTSLVGGASVCVTYRQAPPSTSLPTGSARPCRHRRRASIACSRYRSTRDMA